MSGVERIAAERQRQIDAEGWTPEHDDRHCYGELSEAAACYAMPEADRDYVRDFGTHSVEQGCPLLWPWDEEWWKPAPDNRIRELTKAGALIAAEIDRLERADSQPEETT